MPWTGPTVQGLPLISLWFVRLGSAGPGKHHSLLGLEVLAHSVQVEKLEYETLSEVRLIEERDENFNR